MDMAEKLRASRSRHLLRSAEQAAKQVRAFKDVQPVTPRHPASFVPTPIKQDHTPPRPGKRRQS